MRKGLAWLLAAVGLFCSGVVSAQSTVLCESRGGGYRECYSGFRHSPQIVEQLSSSVCVEGRTWGHRPGAIWVSNGCRAVFGEGGGYAGGGEEGFICESVKGRYTECSLAVRGPVQLVEQLSSRPCVEGQSWGRERGKLWVDQGCRARFAQYYGGHGGGGRDGGYSGGSHWQATSEFTTECSSRGGSREVCEWDWNSGTPYLVDQLSSSPCVNGRSWGYDRSQGLLWVSQGCRAIFGSR